MKSVANARCSSNLNSYLGYWALGMFAGLRSVELQRLQDQPAPWSIIKLEAGDIDLPALPTGSACDVQVIAARFDSSTVSGPGRRSKQPAARPRGDPSLAVNGAATHERRPFSRSARLGKRPTYPILG